MATLQYLILFTIIYYCLLSRVNCDDVTQIIEGFGYPCELHSVKTWDGYILGVHRIPFSRFRHQTKRNNEPVLLMHGILSSSADWVVAGRQISLAFLLSDAGYDVWMGNVRGNTYSKNHSYMSTEESKFWNFSLDELGIIDVPATIDYILENTNHSSLLYVGYSQGTSILMIALSFFPEYNYKIKAAILLAPMVYMKHFPNRFLNDKFVYSAIQMYNRFVDYKEILPKSELDFLSTACDGLGIMHRICVQVISSIVGPIQNIDSSLLSEITKTFPAGASTKQFIHYAQIIKSGKFQLFDLEEGNSRLYGTETPTRLRLGNIDAPIAIFYGTDDNLLAPRDAKRVAKNLKNVIKVFEIDGWNHFDFLYSSNLYEAVNSKIIEIFSMFTK